VRFLTFLAALAGSVYLVFKFLKFKFLLAEDRPEIRVRNRKLTIENTKKNWKRLGSDREWKHDDPYGKPVTAYRVRATGITCGPVTGTDVLVVFETDNGAATYEFEIHLVEGEAVVTSPQVDLDHVVADKKLKIRGEPEGRITQIRVDGNLCGGAAAPGATVEVSLWFLH
jgi:hypothetical protein